MKYLLLLFTAGAAYLVYDKMRPQEAADDDEPVSADSNGPCTEVKVKATVDATDGSGKNWDRDSPPDIVFQVGTKWTSVCNDTLTCQLSFKLPLPAERFEITVWDRDEKDQITGEEAKTELITSGRVRAEGPPARLGPALLAIECLE